MYSFECRDNEEFCDNEKMLKKQFIYNLLIAWCVHKQTATNLIEPKVWPLLWMGWQEIPHQSSPILFSEDRIGVSVVRGTLPAASCQ